MKRLTVTAFTLLSLALPSTGSADPPEYCAPTDEIDPLQLLRQTTLDLLGRVPTYEEYQQVIDADDPDAEVDAMVAVMFESEEYFEQIRAYHRDLVWGTLDTSIIDSIFAGQRRVRPDARQIWRNVNMRQRYRGRADLECLDQQQTDFAPDGRPLPITTFADPSCLNGTCRQEGWVLVTPYWNPAIQLEVCAYDAQEMATGLNSQPCSLYHVNDELCGCGPNLDWCGPDNTGAETIAFRDSLADEPSRIFEHVVREHDSYLDAFTTPTTFMNGPVAHFYRNLSGSTTLTVGGAISYNTAMPAVPDIPFTSQDTWVAVERTGAHAGAFTTLGYLIRFASNRSRANQFYTEFLCDPFVPQEDGLPPEEENPTTNLRERAGCSDCHQVLEPAAAHWARWRTGGTSGYFMPAEYSFEVPRADCLCGVAIPNNCSAFCSQYFVTSNNASAEEFELFGGLPLSAAWIEPSDLGNMEDGPIALVDSPDEQERVAQCAVRQLSEHLLGRELQAGDLQWLQERTDAFAASGYDFSELVEAVVGDERYRTIR